MTPIATKATISDMLLTSMLFINHDQIDPYLT